MIREFLRKLFPLSVRMRYFTPYIIFIKNTKRKNYPHIGKNVDLYGPLSLDPNLITLEEYTRLQPGVRIISENGHCIVRKFSAIGADTLIVPGTHLPTVGLPQYMSTQHINDTATEIVIEEDCWIAARCILLSHCHVCRGAVVAAGTIVTKEVPPYAVVAGSPQKIIATRFTIDQILEHEKSLYPAGERLSREQLEDLFSKHYEGKRSIGATSSMTEEQRQRLRKAKKDLGITEYGEQQ
ncbi:MAG: hypothetical protein LUC33_01875 [Prevotellaceae bacterium]|nr:hypothetical protein [Prevotellaceae bacterium]